jgi:hypothetical protein
LSHSVAAEPGLPKRSSGKTLTATEMATFFGARKASIHALAMWARPQPVVVGLPENP